MSVRDVIRQQVFAQDGEEDIIISLTKEEFEEMKKMKMSDLCSINVVDAKFHFNIEEESRDAQV